jgi:hypothetical protein
MELYGVEFSTDGYGIEINGEYGSYELLIKSLHPNFQWVYKQDNDYQGDFYAVGFDTNGVYALIEGSFGSCSGCDELEAVSNDSDVRTIVERFKKVIIFKDNAEQMVEYLKGTLKNSWNKKPIQELIGVFGATD